MIPEWTAYDAKTQELSFVRADTHKEAIRKAVNNKDIVPRDVNAVRPRTGDRELMSKKEFQNFIDAGLV